MTLCKRSRYASPLCIVGEAIFALVPDAEIWAAKLENRWIERVWRGRGSSTDEHLVGIRFGLLRARSIKRRTLAARWSKAETTSANIARWNFDPDCRPEPAAATTPTRAVPTQALDRDGRAEADQAIEEENKELVMDEEEWARDNERRKEENEEK